MLKGKFIAVNPDPLEKVHYVCTGGCGLVTNEYGKCMTSGCVRNRNPLEECMCKDGKHGNLLTRNIPNGMSLPKNTTLIPVTKPRAKQQK